MLCSYINFTPVTKDEINKNELYMPIVINNGRLQTYNTYHIDTNSMEGFDHDILHSFYDSEIKICGAGKWKCLLFENERTF